METKILVVYASKYGSTAEVAQAIGDCLAERGASIDVKPVGEVISLAGYGAVVIGSAIRMGQWLPEAVAFVKKHQAELNQLPTAIFSVHILALGNGQEDQSKRLLYTEPLHELVTPCDEAFFAGKVDMTRLNFIERMMAKAAKGAMSDVRDWNAIRAWAEELYPILGLA